MNESHEKRVLQALGEATEKKDADGVERALGIAFQNLSPVFVPILITLLSAPWHHRHEDVARALQELKDPRAIDSLYQAAFVRYDYLAYDEFFGLARKCTWALADIGTSEAKARLTQLASGENHLVAGYAQKRLDAWEDERKRKTA
jgi:hypothetical protein